MANDARSNCEVKNYENNNSKEVVSKPSTGSGAETSNAFSLRKSVRETPSKKNMSPSSSSIRKSERLEKYIPTQPLMRKSERFEKQITPISLRRSEQGKKQSFSSSSMSKKSNKILGLSAMKKMLKKARNVEQLALAISTSQKRITEPVQVGKKRMDARAYRASFKHQAKNNVAGHSKEMNKDDKLSLECINNQSLASKSAYKGNEYGQKLREVSAGRDSEKILEESDHSVSKPPVLENNAGLESSHSSQNHGSVGEAYWSEDGDSVEDLEGDDCALLSAHETMSRKLDVVAEMEKISPMVSGASNNDVKSESGHKEISLKRKRNKVDIDSDATAMASSKNICLSAFRASLPERENGADVITRCTEKCIINLQLRDPPAGFQLDGGQNTCLVCKLGGKLLCCEGRGCKRSYHLHCLDPPLMDVPLGVWYCLSCARKKIKLGAPSVSKGIESIWRHIESEENGLQKDFFVKYKGLAHVHNRYVSETQLLLEAPSLVAKFNRKNQAYKWEQEWIKPRRMLQKRFLESPKQLDEVHGGRVDDDLDCHFEWLVKWQGLDYRQASWELENASFMKSPNAQNLMRDYENRLERAKKGHCSSRIYKEREVEKGSVKSNQMSTGGSIELDNNHLDFINNLRGQWHKGQNVIVIDDQERIMKVIAFITSFSSSECWPFLIITSSAAFCSWDEEFFCLAPSIDAVIYHGCKDVRREIRTVEFYVEGDAVMFDVLITSPEVIAEDLDLIDSIKWEVVIVDECQRSRIYSYFEQIKSLNTEMRLLLVNGRLKDDIIEHLLSLLDCESNVTGSEGLVTNSDHRISNLKMLSRYTVNGSESVSSRFVEYWVPVQLSNAQLEQYCANLLVNSLLLCSSDKKDRVGALRDVIISNRKCCDHPYIMDPLLPKSLTEDLKVADALDVDIKASGKLGLLDAMLFELRNRGLRVLILFQSSGGSGKDKIGDILDDFVRLRFGEDSYERVDGLVNRAKKTASLNNFNNQKSRFVFLLETCACLSSIKLSSVDAVIIYSSDWNPANDLRSLQRITFDTKFEQLRIFRLYSSFTVEENVLFLAKHDKTLNSDIQSISPATSHNLLMFGASYLFNKLDEFHSGCALTACRSTSFESVSHEDVVQEFLAIFPQNAKDNNSSNSSTILKAKQNQGNYGTDFLLPGEQKIQFSDVDVPHIFWKKLLDGKRPQWKYSSCLSQRNRKRVPHFNDVLKKPESEGNEVAKRLKKVANNYVDRTSMQSALSEEGNIASAENEGNFGAASRNVHRLMPGSTSHLNSSHSNDTLTSSSFANDKPIVSTVNLAKSSERIHLRDSQKSLHVLLKPEIAKLCEILQLPEDVKAMAQSFLEYVMNNHCVIREPATMLQAFHISVCWMAASLLKYKLDHKESFALARQHLNFGCKKEETDYVYSMLRCLKKMFLYFKGSFTPACSLKTSESLIEVANKDHHAKSSLTTVSSLQKVRVELEDLAHGKKSFDNQVLLLLGQQDFSRSIKDIQKKCDKQKTKLLQKQQEAIEECKRKHENEKAELEKKQKTEVAVIRLHINSSMRIDKLKLLDIEYEKKFEELIHQMKIRCKVLEEMHMAARKKLEERKEKWVKGVISWADMGLINKPSSNATGNSHKNAYFLNSYSKNLNLENIIEDGDIQETVPVSSSGDGEDTVKLSSNEQSSNEATSKVHNKKLPTGGSDNMREPETALPKAMDDGTAIAGENDCDPTRPTEYAIQLNQQNGVMCIINQGTCLVINAGSRVGKSASNNVMEDEKVVEDKTKGNGFSDSSDKTTGFSQQDEETLSGVPEIAGEVEGGENREQQGVEAPSEVPETAAGVVKGNETSKQQDGKVQAVEKVDNLGSESLGGPARVNQQGMDLLQTNGEVTEDANTGREIDGVCVMASNVDNHLQELSGALQEQCLRQTTSTGLQQVEPSVHHQDHVVSNQTTDERVLQMPSGCSAFIPNAMDLPSSGETEHQSSYEGHTSIGIAESSMEMVEDRTVHSNQAISQPVTPLLQHLPDEIPLGGSGMHVSDARSVSTSSGVNNHAVQSVLPARVPPLPLCHDPLQNELERIQKETDQINTIHEDTKLTLKSECEKEIEEVVAEIRRKYESKYQEMESEFLLKIKELDTNHSKVLINKILAKAIRSKCIDIKASSSPEMQQDVPLSFTQQLLQLSSRAPAERTTIMSSLFSAGPAAGGPQIAIPSLHNTAPSIHSTVPVSVNLTRPPVINSIHLAAGNFQMACGNRVPAPHLQPFRSSASAMATNTSSLAVGTAGQQVPGNLPATSAAPAQLQLRPQPSTQHSHLHNIGHQSEASGIMPHSSSSASSLELLMDVENQRNPVTPHCNPRNSDSGSNADVVILSELRPQNDIRTTVTCQNEVVCLSDDD